MPNPKQQLAELIEAYASAKTTNNPLLMGYATNSLQAFLDSAHISQPEPEAEAVEAEPC
jgi:hypothetical protein